MESVALSSCSSLGGCEGQVEELFLEVGRRRTQSGLGIQLSSLGSNKGKNKIGCAWDPFPPTGLPCLAMK